MLVLGHNLVHMGAEPMTSGSGVKYLFLRLHYVPGGHGSHISDNRDQNRINVRQRRGTG